MKNNTVIVGLAMMLLLLRVENISCAAEFSDPNVRALHESLNSLPTRAENGDPQAQNGMGMINAYGFGGSRDFVAAKKWFKMAADQGYPEAMVHLPISMRMVLGERMTPLSHLICTNRPLS